MRSFEIQKIAKRLARLLAEVGARAAIAKTGKPPANVASDPEPTAQRRTRRLGFMRGRFSIPDDFDRWGGAEIERLFGDGE